MILARSNIVESFANTESNNDAVTKFLEDQRPMVNDIKKQAACKFEWLVFYSGFM